MIDTLPKAKKNYLNKRNRIIDYELIQTLHKEEGYDIDFMCGELGISRAAYYKWTRHQTGKRERENRELLRIIEEVSASNNSLFGSMTMTYYIRNVYGIRYNHKRIYRLMCIHDIVSNYRRKSSYHYRRSTPEITAENVLNRDFNADHINRKWCTDITEMKVPLSNDKIYISPVIDLADRYPVAIYVSERNDTILTDRVLEIAHEAYPNANPVYHSDRGFQYTREVFKTKLEKYGYTQSMSRVSKCIDNGPCEQFQGQLKEILQILYPDIKTKEELIEAVYKAADYYINFYPQRRFQGKTAGQVREEALDNKGKADYPIADNPKYIRYWEHIELLKLHSQQSSILSE